MNHFAEFGQIGVLMGGVSCEREISLKSGQAVTQALQQKGCRVQAIDIRSADPLAVRTLLKSSGIDVAFLALHGMFGEDGTIQAILEEAGIPYTGSGVEASRIAISKIETQKLLRSRKIPVADFFVLKRGDSFASSAISEQLGGLPVVVKPEKEGSSLGISIVRQLEDFARAVEEAFHFGPSLLIEQFIPGRELTVGIVEDQPLPVIEIRPRRGFFDFTAKYEKGFTEYLVPAPLPEKLSRLVQQTALDAFAAVGCRDFGRVDIILSDKGRPYVLEINTIPGFTSMSLLPKAAQQAGLEFGDLCLKLIELAYEKENQKK